VNLATNNYSEHSIARMASWNEIVQQTLICYSKYIPAKVAYQKLLAHWLENRMAWSSGIMI
jgi:hypothetical protein